MNKGFTLFPAMIKPITVKNEFDAGCFSSYTNSDSLDIGYDQHSKHSRGRLFVPNFEQSSYLSSIYYSS